MNNRMNEHTQITDLLPLYVSGALDRDQRAAVEQHLPTCAECQADLALWHSLVGEVRAQSQSAAAPRGLAERALAALPPAQTRPLRRAPAPTSALARLRRMAQLLRAQAPLVQREIWPVSAAVIGLGYAAALVAEQSVFIYALAPLIAATCVSLIYGPENDPAFELTLSTPTSPRQILLARLVLVFGYNLALVLVAALGLLPMLAAQTAQPLLGTMILSWLAPMTFLSAAALVLSLWIGATNAISMIYVAWLAQLMANPLLAQQTGLTLSPALAQAAAVYQQFWHTPTLLFALAAALFALAVWLSGRQERGLLIPA